MEGKGAAGTAAMEVHHFNGDHENNGMQNLGTTDYFCHACNHIGFLGKNAVLGFLPELSLIDTNHLFRTMAVAIASGDEEMKQAALEIEEALRPASDVFAQVWGTKNPTDIGNAMLAMPKEAYDSRDVVMSGVRVLFNLSRPYIRQVGETVLAKAHTALKPDVWPEIANQYLVENLAEWESLSQGELSKQDGGVVNA